MKPALFLALILSSLMIFAEEAKLKPEEIVNKSLAAIATPEARAKLQGIQISGKAKLSGSTGGVTGDGTGMLASQGNKIRFETKLNNPQYTGDLMVTDGKNVQVNKDSAGQRSTLGELVVLQPGILSYGLLGGVDTTAWLLNDPKLRGGKLNSSGLKKVDEQKRRVLVIRRF